MAVPNHREHAHSPIAGPGLTAVAHPRRYRRLLWPAVGSVLAATLLVLDAPGVQASTPGTITCGDQITQSVVLTQNLTCVGTALEVVPAQGPITVNLGGHTVTSTAAASTCADAAIVLAGLSPATLENGRVLGSGPGVCNASPGNVYQHLTFDGAGWANTASDSQPTVRDNVFIHGAGFATGQNTVYVEYNEFLGGPPDDTAISAPLVDGVISDNTITGYGVGMNLGDSTISRTVSDNTIAGAGVGIEITSLTQLGTITGNRLLGNEGDGILIAWQASGGPATVSGNIAVGNGGDGIEVQSTAGGTVTFADNVALGNAGHGIVAPSGSVNDGGNRAAANRTPPQCVNLSCFG